MISFCITNKNRSRLEIENETLELLPKCIDSIIASCKNIDEEVEVVVSDWQSTDWALDDWIYDRFKNTNIKIKVVTILDNKRFNLGHGRNIAFDNCSGDKIFFVDADMLISEETIEEGLYFLSNNFSFFPQSFKEKNNEFAAGCGNVITLRENHERIRFHEIPFWGAEDNIYTANCKKFGIPVIRTRIASFIHQWHPKRVGWVVRPKGHKKNMNLAREIAGSIPDCNISIVIPNFNNKDSLTTTIDSIIAQNCNRWDLYICDDNSSDGSRQVISDYVKKYDNIKAIYNDLQLGYFNCIDKCVSASKNDLIGVLNSGDTFIPEALNKFFDIYRNHFLLCSNDFNTFSKEMYYYAVKIPNLIGDDYIRKIDKIGTKRYNRAKQVGKKQRNKKNPRAKFFTDDKFCICGDLRRW